MLLTSIIKTANRFENRTAPLVPRWFVLAFLIIMVGISRPALGQAPSIKTISPSTVTAGSAAFPLTITGANFLSTSEVAISGTILVPTTTSAAQLTVTVPSNLVASAASLSVTVFDPGATGAGATSNAVPLLVTAPAPAPVLTSATPQAPAQGASQIRMTLVGSNFRPGATVVISPPLASLSASTGNTQAADISVMSVVLVNSGLMIASIDISPTAATALRAIDVRNADGTSTIGSPTSSGFSGSTQPMRVQAASSLGAPLTILNMGLLHPRDGTVVMQGQELDADAILAGSGTGTVIGQWVWDGNVVEQFSASIVGGNSTTIRTRQSLPTAFLGAHRLQLRMIQPNQVASAPITVVVNPGGWKLEQLILPAYGRAFAAASPPTFLWAPVPGAEKYQVGFSTQPYLSTVGQWFDVVDNRWDSPALVWRKLPEGRLYWTVRTVDSDGVTRKPLPMRVIYHIAEGELSATHPAPSQTAAGHTLLEWKPAATNGYYFVTISSDYAGADILRQYLTRDPQLDLRAVEARLLPGMTYYWQIDALAPTGQLLFSGPVQSFVAVAGPQADESRVADPVLLASVGAPAALPAAPDLSSEIAAQTPAPGSSTSQLQPAISVSFQAPVNPGDVSLMGDEIDVTSLAQVAEDKVSYTPPLALAGGEHDVNLAVGSNATTWKFTVLAPPAATAPSAPAAPAAFEPGTDAEAPPPAAPPQMPQPPAIAAVRRAKKSSAKNTPRPELDGQLGANTQWVSGSNPPDSNLLSAAEHLTYQKGLWHIEANGSGALNSVLNPETQRTSKGLVNDYVLQAGYKQEAWGVNLRFGIITPALYTDAQFVTAATPRQGAELTISSPVGTLGSFANTDDTALGGGSGINFHQQILGASYQAPLPQWAQFRLMWLSAQDTGAPTTVGYDSQGNPIILPNPVATASAGDVMGALLNVHLKKQWLWTSEYAISYDNADTADPASTRAFGRAWRTGISGTAGTLSASGDYREESANFGNPANPSLTQSSQPDVRGADATVTDTTHAGNFGLTYTFLDNNTHPTTSDELLMNSFDETWSKALNVKTNLSVESRQSLTKTGTVPAALAGLPPDQTGAQDLRDISGTLNLTRQVGAVSITAGATRDWSRNNLTPSADTITSSINGGVNLATQGFFQLNAQVNANWVAADGQTTGTTSDYTVNVQPAFAWKQTGLQISPLVTITKGQTKLSSGTLSSNSLTGQYGGRVAWTLPGAWKFSTFSAQGSYNQNHDTVAGLDQNTTQLLVVWTATWSHKHTF